MSEVRVWLDEMKCSPQPYTSWDTPLESRRVTIIGGSPVLEMGGRPVVWFENWIRARTRKERMR